MVKMQSVFKITILGLNWWSEYIFLDHFSPSFLGQNGIFGFRFYFEGELMKEYIILIKNNLFLFKGNTKKTFVFSYIIILRNRVSFLFFCRDWIFIFQSLHSGKVIYPKYSKHWIPSTCHTQLIMCAVKY